jgi:fumarate reductase subunit C
MSDLNHRIEAMYQSDKRNAYILIALLWIVVLFVVVMSWPFIPDSGVRFVSLIGAAAVLIFNTAAVMAMLNHYAEDKHFIYGMDIKMLDAAKDSQGA